MIRKHENSVSWKAGGLAVAVHAVLLGALLISFNWKVAHTVLNVTEVDLWDKIPGKSTPKPPDVKVEPKPIVKEVPKPELPKPMAEERPKPEEPKVDINLEKKKKELAEKEEQLEEKKLEDKRKKDEEKKKLLAAMRDEDLQNKADEKKQKDALKKLQQEALNDEKGDSDKKASAANASKIGEYIDKIRAKIHSKVSNTSCADGNPELFFEIGLLPTGELSGTPKITKSSGSSACDDAVERAIIASEPLPLPSDPNLFSNFRNLNLKFRPND